MERRASSPDNLGRKRFLSSGWGLVPGNSGPANARSSITRLDLTNLPRSATSSERDPSTAHLDDCGEEVDDLRESIKDHIRMTMRESRQSDLDFSCPEFPHRATWINVAPKSRPKTKGKHVTRPSPLDYCTAPSSRIRMTDDLRGRLVILEFFSCSYVESRVMLDSNTSLASAWEHDDAVCFIGVHCPRLEGDEDLTAAANNIMGMGIERPVLHDKHHEMQTALGISKPPSIVIVAPNGTLLLVHYGVERSRLILTRLIEEAMYYFETRQELKRDPLPVSSFLYRHAVRQMSLLKKDSKLKFSTKQSFLAMKSTDSNTPPLRAKRLHFPTKIAIDTERGRLFISDTGNNRIVVLSVKGNFLCEIGSGESGLVDGNYQSCCFHQPMGLCYRNQYLYIADSLNHAIRRVDLKTKNVETLIGNGIRNVDDITGGAMGTFQSLNYPVDVAIRDDNPKYLYIAMPGSHQIWQYNRKTRETSSFSGVGRPLVLNSPLPSEAGWAYPSGLHTQGALLFVVDSASHCLRGFNFNNNGATSTYVGSDLKTTNGTFKHGDSEGPGRRARLQGPGSIHYVDKIEKIVISDTMNHKLKVYNTITDDVTDLIGSGWPGHRDGYADEGAFNMPDGLAVDTDGRTLYVVDKHNHCIRIVDVFSSEVTTMDISQVPLGSVVEGKAGGHVETVDHTKEEGALGDGFFTRGIPSTFNVSVSINSSMSVS